jgi:ribosomal protein S18 acetylase RimI-like enzyme
MRGTLLSILFRIDFIEIYAGAWAEIRARGKTTRTSQLLQLRIRNREIYLMKTILASEFGNNTKMKISQVFVDGFFQWLHFFSKDKEKLIQAFCHMFNLEVFYVAVIDSEIAGIAACTDGKIPTVKLNSNQMKKHLGFFMGTIAYLILKREFETKKYPFKIEKGMGMVEFVATSTKYRGKGVATAILNHIFASTPYTIYALEVADTNTNAINLYEKLGFIEFLRIKQKGSKRSGINHLVYMKYNKK